MTHLAHFATERALAPVAPIPSLDTAAAILSVAEALQPDLAQGAPIDALRLRVEMERVFGGSDATGAWDWKLAYEAGEAALVPAADGAYRISVDGIAHRVSVGG